MTEPARENESFTESGCEVDAVFPAGADFLDGHFDGAPVVPGVVQTGAAVLEIERMLGRRVRVTEVRKLKFAKAVRPGERVHLSVSRRGGGEWAFRWESEGAVCSSGVVVAE